ncbi:MAG: PhoX family phosphatase [Planctomycetota bacterium]
MVNTDPEVEPREEKWEDDGFVDNLPGTPERPTASESFQSVLRRAITRRTMVQGSAATAATFVLSRPAEAAPAGGNAGEPGDSLTFRTVPTGDGSEPDIRVPPNYRYQVILKWGDPLFAGAPEFDVNNQTAASQSQQFGFNADLVLWYPLQRRVKLAVESTGQLVPAVDRFVGSTYPILKNLFSRRALMVVNHEYTKGSDMFPGYSSSNPTREQVETEIEAHGFSVVEVALDFSRKWNFQMGSAFTRRITGSSPHEITGPLRGDDRMKTSADPTGTEVLGCLNNCAGGKTPWGTILTCEENFDQYFGNFDSVDQDTRRFSTRIAAPGGESGRKWERFVDRFDLSTDANEYHRFGYIVEIDPYDPNDTPKKRTALGRFKHEGASSALAPDNRVAIYSGDDARFEYVYKFVSNGSYDRNNRAANKSLLDDGVLYVARFDAGSTVGDEMGTGEWLPLVWHAGNALDQAGYTSQQEVLLDTRGAADVLGATPMDRPEDIEVNPVSNHVFIALTNNSRRDGDPGDTRIVNGREVSSAPNEANPRNDTFDNGDPNDRTGNQHGHVIELIEDNDDAAATTFTWNIFVKCGDPAVPAHDTRFADIADPIAAGVSPISDPDNLVHDENGNLWISTDGMFFSGSAGFGVNDGIFAVPVTGAARGVLRQFLSSVPGSEVCGPEFTGDNRQLFCAIQHPRDGEAFDEIWPIGAADVSRPALIAVREVFSRKIGT